jgi:hypothetical protein
MPEHVHLILSEPAKKTPSRALQVLKQKVARTLLRKRRKTLAGQLSLPFEDDAVVEPQLWQRRFYDFNIWSEKKLREEVKIQGVTHEFTAGRNPAGQNVASAVPGSPLDVDGDASAGLDPSGRNGIREIVPNDF